MTVAKQTKLHVAHTWGGGWQSEAVGHLSLLLLQDTSISKMATLSQRESKKTRCFPQATPAPISLASAALHSYP